MNVESFENEIAQLESQLQDAIAALRALKDIQATFQDMQPRYERLKQLTDAAAGLPEHYARQFESARQQAEVRLAHLETQVRQQQTRWDATLQQHQQAHRELQQHGDQALVDVHQRLETHQNKLTTLAVRQQQDQVAAATATAQATTELQHAIAALDERASLVNTSLKAFVEKAFQNQAEQLREKFTRQFRWASLTGFIGWVIALGTLAVALR